MSVKNDYLVSAISCGFVGLIGSGIGALTAATIAAAPVTIPIGALAGAISVVVILAPNIISKSKNDNAVSTIIKIASFFFAAVAITMSSGASFPLACGFSLLCGFYSVSAILFLSLLTPKISRKQLKINELLMNLKNNFALNQMPYGYLSLLGTSVGVLAAATISTGPISLPLGAFCGACSLVLYISLPIASSQVARFAKIDLSLLITLGFMMLQGATFPVACRFSLLFGVYTVSALLFLSLLTPKMNPEKV